MRWLLDLFAPQVFRPQSDRDAVERREAQLRDRLARLERMAAESDVISHTDHPEDRPWNER